MDFKNRVALVTGGSGALGSAVVIDLLGSGARVVATYTSGIAWRKLQEQAGARREQLEGVSVDLTRGADVGAVIAELKERWGRLDFLVAAAGGFAVGKSYDTDDATWDRMFNINFRTLVNALRPVVPIMMAQNFGRIVSVSSGAILSGAGAGIAAYVISKVAVQRLTEILAEELRSFDIRCFSVLPGTMDTEANRRAMPEADFSQWVTTHRVAEVIHGLLQSAAGSKQPVTVPVLR